MSPLRAAEILTRSEGLSFVFFAPGKRPRRSQSARERLPEGPAGAGPAGEGGDARPPPPGPGSRIPGAAGCGIPGLLASSPSAKRPQLASGRTQKGYRQKAVACRGPAPAGKSLTKGILETVELRNAGSSRTPRRDPGSRQSLRVARALRIVGAAPSVLLRF